MEKTQWHRVHRKLEECGEKVKSATLGVCCKAAGTSRSVAIEQEPKHLPAKQYANGALTESVEMPSIRSQS